MNARAVVAPVLTALCAGLVLAGCGSETTADTSASDGSSASQEEAPSPSQPTAAVPGNPDNTVRPATADELASWPGCDDVWSADGEIPGDYRGCVTGQDVVVADRITCSFGGSMTTFDDRYYGVVGAVVNDAEQSLSASPAYAKAFRQCTA